MGQGTGEGVGGIGRGQAGQLEHPLHHVADLVLGRAAVADHRLLDLQRRVFVDAEPATGQRRDRCAARLTQQQGRAGVDVDEDDLADGDLGPVLADQRDDAFMDPAQPFRQGAVAADDDAAGQVLQAAAGVLLDDPEAGTAQPRVDTDDPQARCRIRAGRARAAIPSAGNASPR